MKEYRYRNAIIRVFGENDREKIKDATIAFLKKADRYKKNIAKEKSQNGN